MGFWDFVAPDFESFSDVMTPYLPELVYVGLIPVPRDVVISEAWLTPASAVGLAARTFYTIQSSGGNRTDAENSWNGTNSHINGVAPQKIILGETNAMAQLIISGIVRVAIVMTAGGREISNVIHVNAGSAGQEVAATAAVQTAWKMAAGPLSQLSNLVTMSRFEGMDLSTSNGGITTVTDSTAGGISGTPALSTRASAALIKWNGGTRSASSRGRLYYGPLREADINADGATLVSGQITVFTTAFTNFRTSLGTAGYPLVVASKTNSAATSVTSHAVETTIATQRRRLRS